MKAKLSIIVLVTISATCAYPNYKSNEIEYRGVKIKLSKSYSDFDKYKNDPDNIDPSETTRVQQMVMDAPMGHQFESLIDASKAVSEIAFPGYGSSGFQQQPQPDGSVLMGFSVEIPRAEKDRCFVFRGIDGKYRLIDDFIAPEFPSIARVNEENGLLVYSTTEGEKILTRPLLK
jgi:hypothetical protein